MVERNGRTVWLIILAEENLQVEAITAAFGCTIARVASMT